MMTDVDPRDHDYHADGGMVATQAMPRGATWRYRGERAAADLAYCARFGVADTPEPFAMGGDIWAYALPGTASQR